MSETPEGTWLGGARKGSLWLHYAGLLTGIQKSGISGNGQRPKPTPRENSWEVRRGGRSASDRKKEESTQI